MSEVTEALKLGVAFAILISLFTIPILIFIINKRIKKQIQEKIKQDGKIKQEQERPDKRDNRPTTRSDRQSITKNTKVSKSTRKRWWQIWKRKENRIDKGTKELTSKTRNTPTTRDVKQQRDIQIKPTGSDNNAKQSYSKTNRYFH